MRDSEIAARAQEGHAATSPRRPIEETARLGEEMYERDIRQHVEPNHDGKIIAIHIVSGDYAIADDIIPAVDLLRAQRTNDDLPGDEVWCVRVGYRALASLGGGNPRRAR